MATLYITEYGSLQAGSFSPSMPAAVTPSMADQVVTIGASSVQSAAVTSQTQLVRLFADANCCVKFGTAPTATATSLPLAANVPEYFQVLVGQSFKVAVIARA